MHIPLIASYSHLFAAAAAAAAAGSSASQNRVLEEEDICVNQTGTGANYQFEIIDFWVSLLTMSTPPPGR